MDVEEARAHMLTPNCLYQKIDEPRERKQERKKKKSNDFMDVNYLSLLLCRWRRKKAKMTRKWVFGTQITCVHIVSLGLSGPNAVQNGAAKDNKK